MLKDKLLLRTEKRSLLVLIALCMICAVSPAFAAQEPATVKPDSVTVVPDSRNQIVKLTDKGIEPAELHMKREDSIAFFLNDTKDSLATIEIEFGDKHTHCSSGNLRIIDGGKLTTLRPFGPSDFSTTCFHDPGAYEFTVFGLKPNPKGLKGRIIVE